MAMRVCILAPNPLPNPVLPPTLQAGYCQGMAFVAGLLLFYVPEEPAFQLSCRLLRWAAVKSTLPACRLCPWLCHCIFTLLLSTYVALSHRIPSPSGCPQHQRAQPAPLLSAGAGGAQVGAEEAGLPAGAVPAGPDGAPQREAAQPTQSGTAWWIAVAVDL